MNYALLTPKKLNAKKYQVFYDRYVKPYIDVDGLIKTYPYQEHTENGILFTLYYILLAEDKYDVDLSEWWETSVSKLEHNREWGRFYMTPRPSSEKDYASTDNISAIVFGSLYLNYDYFDYYDVKNLDVSFKYRHPRDLIFLNYIVYGKYKAFLPLVYIMMTYSLLVTRDPSTTLLWWMKSKTSGLQSLESLFVWIMKMKHGGNWKARIFKDYFKEVNHPVHKLIDSSR